MRSLETRSTLNRREVLKTVAATLVLPKVSLAAESGKPIQVVVWDERQPQQKQAYENFLGNAIAEHLRKSADFQVKSVALDDPEQGLSNDTLDACDVLIWWGHVRNRDLKPDKAKTIVDRVERGKLSLIVLHSAHWSSPFIEAMAGGRSLTPWRRFPRKIARR